MKRGFKRSFVLLMLAVSPLVYDQPVSSSQDLAPNPGTLSSDISTSMERLLGVIYKPVFYGIASWYSRSDLGIKKRTASGAVFDDTKRACASWSVPLGTRVRVTNLKNGKSVICVVNNRGLVKKLKRLVNLTKAAFREIADTKHGLIRVSVVPLSVTPKRLL